MACIRHNSWSLLSCGPWSQHMDWLCIFLTVLLGNLYWIREDKIKSFRITSFRTLCFVLCCVMLKTKLQPWFCVFLFSFLFCILAVFCHLNQTFASVLEMTVKPGNNIILYCDCKVSTGVFIVWYKNCSHKNHPTPLKLKRTTTNYTDPLKFPNFHYLRNYSSDSYDLLILNINDSDEGLYYCGTEENKVEDKEYIKWKTIYKYGRKATRILLSKYSAPNYWLITQWH